MQIIYKIILFTFLFSLFCALASRKDSVKSGPASFLDVCDTVISYPLFHSEFVDDRNIEIYLPAGYNSRAKKEYKLLVIHDGQNVFNRATAYGGKEWGLDEALDTLIQKGLVTPTIVVAIWNNGKKRYNEYLPAKPNLLTDNPTVKNKFSQTSRMDSLLADNYLNFITKEVLPFVEKNFRVSRRSSDRAIMGSSMGGLVSLYAICSYPNVFGAAGCISTHWVITEDKYIDRLLPYLPDPKNHRVYFDYGTQTLDAQYEPFQMQADSVMHLRGFIEGENWITKKFDGAAHDETSWRQRLPEVLMFLLEVE